MPESPWGTSYTSIMVSEPHHVHFEVEAFETVPTLRKITLGTHGQSLEGVQLDQGQIRGHCQKTHEDFLYIHINHGVRAPSCTVSGWLSRPFVEGLPIHVHLQGCPMSHHRQFRARDHRKVTGNFLYTCNGARCPITDCFRARVR